MEEEIIKDGVSSNKEEWVDTDVEYKGIKGVEGDIFDGYDEIKKVKGDVVFGKEEGNIIELESNEVDNIELEEELEDKNNMVEYNCESFVILNFVYSKTRLFSPFISIFSKFSSVSQERYNKYKPLLSIKEVENPFLSHLLISYLKMHISSLLHFKLKYSSNLNK